ncbi:RNA-directed DNA polymerase from mobile element jockey [Trichonephila clavipes]|nr:RNA-directed DNA polymerase from mobile element jockey [Trichonephila clavipes]
MEIIHYIKHVNAKKAPDNWKEAIIFPINKPGEDPHLVQPVTGQYPLLSTIGRNSHLSIENKVLLYTAVMRPILAYASPVWGYAAKTNINKLDTLQNSLIPDYYPPLAGRNGILYSDDEKAEEFKNNLEATFQENAEPYNDQIIELVESETSDFLANSSMQVPPLTSPAEISKIISKLQNKKASATMPLNAITHLTKIINTCLKHRFFPSLWKSANVIMLPKPNQNHKLAQNYRPISLLCATAKIYEKIILNRIN